MPPIPSPFFLTIAVYRYTLAAWAQAHLVPLFHSFYTAVNTFPAVTPRVIVNIIKSHSPGLKRTAYASPKVRFFPRRRHGSMAQSMETTSSSTLTTLHLHLRPRLSRGFETVYYMSHHFVRHRRIPFCDSLLHLRTATAFQFYSAYLHEPVLQRIYFHLHLLFTCISKAVEQEAVRALCVCSPQDDTGTIPRKVDARHTRSTQSR